MKKVVILLFLYALCVPRILFAEDVTVSASLSSQSVSVNDEIRLTIVITGSRGNIQAPRLPALNGFDTYYTGRASHITFINNVQTSKVEFSYVLIPKAAGKFNLPSIEVLVGSSRYRTQAMTIEVSASSQSASTRRSPQRSQVPQQQSQGFVQPPPQEPPPTFQPDDDNIFIRASVDKTSVYPNEQVLLTYSLYTRYDTRYEGFAEEPEMSGFWIEEFPMERDIRRETVRVNGKRYVKADIRKIALFPTTPADYTILPGTIRVSVRHEPQSQSIFDEFFNDSFFSGSGFFSKRENRVLKPPAIELKVRPFPEKDQPEDFQGVVGNYKMSASVDKQDATQNEPVTLTIVLEGEGNIETLNFPEVEDLPNFKVYESDSSSELFKAGNVIGGRKTFEIVFIPLEAGDTKIPKLSFSFFNPKTHQYNSIYTPEYPLKVKPSDKVFEMPKNLAQRDLFKKDIELEGKDIRFITEKISKEKYNEFIYIVVIGLGAVNAVLSLIIIAGLWRNRTENIYAKDSALKRRKLAKSRAESGIKGLKKIKGKNADEITRLYFEEIDKIMTQYISDKFNLSAQGTTRMDIERHLGEVLGSDDELQQSVLEVYQVCDESRFAQKDQPEELRAEALRILKQTITRIERVRK